jgi:hypothetical protein
MLMFLNITKGMKKYVADNGQNFDIGMQVQICNFKSAKGNLYKGWIGVITEKKDDGKFMVKFDNIEKQASFAPKNLEWTSLESKIQNMGLYRDASILWIIGDANHAKSKEIRLKIRNLAKEKNGFCFQETIPASHYTDNLDDLKAGFRYIILIAFTAIKADKTFIDPQARKEYCQRKIQTLLGSMAYNRTSMQEIKEYKMMINKIWKCKSKSSKTDNVLISYANEIVNGTIDLDFEKIYNHYFEDDPYSEIMQELLQSDPFECYKIVCRDNENMPECLKLEDSVKEKIKIIEQDAREIEMAKRVLERINNYPKIPTVVITGRAHLKNLVSLLGTAGGKEIRTCVIYGDSKSTTHCSQVMESRDLVWKSLNEQKQLAGEKIDEKKRQEQNIQKYNILMCSLIFLLTIFLSFDTLFPTHILFHQI